MPRKPMKVKLPLPEDDVLDLGAAQHRVASVRDYGRMDVFWQNVRFPAMWTLSAFLSLAIVVMLLSTDRGSERLAALPLAMAELVGNASGPSPARLAQLVDREVGAAREEARRLGAERSRLEQRVAQLERDVSDVTGSVRRGNDITGSIVPAGRELPSSAPSRSLVAPGETLAPVEASLPKPEPRGEAENSAPGAVTLATRTQFGLDLGSENTVTGLRLRWLRLSERHKALLVQFEPLIAVRDGANGLPVLYLLAGPVGDAAEAAALCAKLRQGNVTCQPAPYDGQRLALR